MSECIMSLWWPLHAGTSLGRFTLTVLSKYMFIGVIKTPCWSFYRPIVHLEKTIYSSAKEFRRWHNEYDPLPRTLCSWPNCQTIHVTKCMASLRVLGPGSTADTKLSTCFSRSAETWQVVCCSESSCQTSQQPWGGRYACDWVWMGWMNEWVISCT